MFAIPVIAYGAAASDLIAHCKISDECIGCGACEEICPEVFEVGDDVKARVRDNASGDASVLESIFEARNSCPVEAIDIWW